MNVITSETHTKELPKESEPEDLSHCYANVTVNDPSETPPYLTPTEVNYVELDLDSKGATVSNPTESPGKVKKSYATIDFNKTNALSQSVNQRMENDQGSRKTRHNSTISDVPARHSNSSSD